MRFPARPCLLMGVIGLSVLTAPLIKGAGEWLLQAFPSSALFDLDTAGGSYDFGRIYRRLLLVLTLLLGTLGRKWLGPISLRGIGTGSRPGRQVGSGFVLGCFSLSLFLAIFLLMGERSLAPAVPADWSWRAGRALASALVVGVVEETIFRGYLLGGFLGGGSRLGAVVWSSALFSAVHFLRAPVRVTPGLHLGVGLQALVAHLRPLGRPEVFFPFVGLLLLGMLLAYAYLWTDSLPFAIGLHAGWVFLVMTAGLLLREPTGIEWLYGEQGVLARVGGWILLLLMVPMLRAWIRWTSITDHR
ncbi:MAG: CPBP family intramembrane glutamic endopeptidase [Candidatus Methylomirabilales bacterium]